MENGVWIINEYPLGEKEVIKDEVLDLKVEDLAIEGVDESNNSEGDAVFEEANEAAMLNIDIEGVHVAVKEEENIEKNGNLGDSLELDGRLDVTHEAEKFEEAIGVHNIGQNHEELDPSTVFNEKIKGNVEDIDAVTVSASSDDHNVSEGVLKDDLLLQNDQLVDNMIDEVKEASYIGADEVVLDDESSFKINENNDVLENTSGEESRVTPETSRLPSSGDSSVQEDKTHIFASYVLPEDFNGSVSQLENVPIEDLNRPTDYHEQIEGMVDNKDAVTVSAISDEHNDPEGVLKDDVLLGNDQLVDNVKDVVKEASDLGISEEVLDNEFNVNENTGLVLENAAVEESTVTLESSRLPSSEDVVPENFKGSLPQLESVRIEDFNSSTIFLEKIDGKDAVTFSAISDEHNDGEGLLKDDVLLGNDQLVNIIKDEVKEASNLGVADEVVLDGEFNVNEKTGVVLENTSVEESTVLSEAIRLPSSEDSRVQTEDKTQSFASYVVPENPFAANFKRPTTKIGAVRESIVGTRKSEITSPADVPSSTKSPAPASASSAVPSPAALPAGLGRAAPLLEPSPRVVQQPRVNGTVSQMQNQLIEEPTNGEAEENNETREKLQMIRVKFLRLAHRLGQTPHNGVVAQVLYRLGLAEQLRGGTGGRVAAFSFDRASAMAEQLEAGGQEPLDFSCTIMVLGKTGVGKSATINSIFDQVKFGTDAFQLGTKKVQDVVGTVQGIKVRVIDTPGLLPSFSDQRRNEKILQSVKQFIKKSPPDIVLYLDRLDMQSRDSGDMPLLRTITDIFGASIWFNAIVVLTHAASAPPEGPNGVATGYDMFVTQRSHVVQQAIRQAAGDMRLMNPVSLVENHSACRTNRAGQRVLPNGQVWKPHLLLLSFASKILAEANLLLNLQDGPPGKPFVARARAPPLPFLLSSLLQSRPQPKLPHEQFGDDDDTLDHDLDESTDSDDDSEYDKLPPFKQLTRAQLSKLNKAQKKAYYDELELREKLFMKKQLKEEKRRRRLMKKMSASANELLPNDFSESVEEESNAASVPVAMPDFSLPASFGSDNPTHRYRHLDSSNQWLVRPVLDTHGWDHDVGYEGVNVERLFVVKDKMPVSFSGQVTKDKKDANIQMEVAGSVKHGEGKATTLGFDMQQIGKDIAYTIRSDTRFSNFRRNKATVGLSATRFGDSLIGGVKVEDKLIVGRRGQVVISGGGIIGRGDVAYGGSLEATLRDKDYPLGHFLTTMGLSVMDWHGDLAIGWNAQSQIPIGRYTNLIGRINLNNRGQGQVSIRLNSSEQLQIALVSLVPLLRKLFGYTQPTQFGY